jgi:hypothetical protein
MSVLEKSVNLEKMNQVAYKVKSWLVYQPPSQYNHQAETL